MVKNPSPNLITKSLDIDLLIPRLRSVQLTHEFTPEFTNSRNSVNQNQTKMFRVERDSIVLCGGRDLNPGSPAWEAGVLDQARRPPLEIYW
jgi:hypothetical protein